MILDLFSSPYLKITSDIKFSSALFIKSLAVGPFLDILMSNGPSCLNENPLKALSSCIDETPISKQTPSTSSISKLVITFFISIKFELKKFILFGHFFSNLFTYFLTSGSKSRTISFFAPAFNK